MALGDKIKQLREAKKLSVRKLAALAALSKTTISEIENNIVVNPTKDTINQIAKVLGVPPGLLLEEEGTIDKLAGVVYNSAEFMGDLAGLSASEKREMLKDLIVQEPQAVYEAIKAKGYIGPLSDDEYSAVQAYLAVYRKSKKG